jgi:hypothetical protein
MVTVNKSPMTDRLIRMDPSSKKNMCSPLAAAVPVAVHLMAQAAQWVEHDYITARLCTMAPVYSSGGMDGLCLVQGGAGLHTVLPTALGAEAER